MADLWISLYLFGRSSSQMFRTAILALALGAAAAFVAPPVPLLSAPKTVVKADFSRELGAQVRINLCGYVKCSEKSSCCGHCFFVS